MVFVSVSDLLKFMYWNSGDVFSWNLCSFSVLVIR